MIGDNGSGKSTLAQLMAGWYPDYLPGLLDIGGTGKTLLAASLSGGSRW